VLDHIASSPDLVRDAYKPRAFRDLRRFAAPANVYVHNHWNAIEFMGETFPA
jgi:hypothetical protein